ncbi:probable glutathione S-transferase parA [Musa acuminata AAA Group]|uniref:probable glutathione S-transferase parA n=1 Tax=Musa acuminata AAA Group TaxID=214697 RepID=UPI0031D7DD42
MANLLRPIFEHIQGDKSPLLLESNLVYKTISVLIHGAKLFYECGTRLWKFKGSEQAAAKEVFIGNLRLLEGELGDKKYFAGDAFGFVEIAIVPFGRWFYSYMTCAGFSIEEAAPNLVAWGKRCMERESVTKALCDPHNVYELVSILRKRDGVE